MGLQSKCFLFSESEWGRVSSSWLRGVTEDCWEKPGPWRIHGASESSNPEACLSSGFSLRGFTLNCASLSWFFWYLQHIELWHRSALGTDSQMGWSALIMALLSTSIFTSPFCTTWNAILEKRTCFLKCIHFPEGIIEPVDAYLWYECSHANSLSLNANKVSYTLYTGAMMCQIGRQESKGECDFRECGQF